MEKEKVVCPICHTELKKDEEKELTYVCLNGHKTLLITFSPDDINPDWGSENRRCRFIDWLPVDDFYDFLLTSGSYWDWLNARWELWLEIDGSEKGEG